MSTDRRLFFLLHRAHRALFNQGNVRAMDALGITTAQLGALYFVAKNDGCSLSDIANTLEMNKSAVTNLARRLERSGVLRREADPADGRGSRLFITEKGGAIRTQSLALIRRLTAEATEGFSEGEVETVFRFLTSIVGRFGDGAPPT